MGTPDGACGLGAGETLKCCFKLWSNIPNTKWSLVRVPFNGVKYDHVIVSVSVFVTTTMSMSAAFRV